MQQWDLNLSVLKAKFCLNHKGDCWYYSTTFHHIHRKIFDTDAHQRKTNKLLNIQGLSSADPSQCLPILCTLAKIYFCWQGGSQSMQAVNSEQHHLADIPCLCMKERPWRTWYMIFRITDSGISLSLQHNPQFIQHITGVTKKKKKNIAAFSSFYSFYFFFFLQCQMHFQCSHVMLRCYIRIYESWLLNNNCILPNNTQDCKQQYQLENNRIYCEPEREPTFISWVRLQLFTWTGLFTAHNVWLLCICCAVYMVAQICQCQFDSWCTSEYKNHGH